MGELELAATRGANLMRGRTVQRLWLVFEVLSEDVMRDFGGFDDTLREPELAPTLDGIGVTKHDQATKAVRVRGQVTSGTIDVFFKQSQEGGGDAPKTTLTLEIHKRDLQRKNLLSPEQESLIKINDKLVRVESRQGKTIWQAPENPGLYINEVDPFTSGTDVIQYKLSVRTEGAKI